MNKNSIGYIIACLEFILIIFLMIIIFSRPGKNLEVNPDYFIKKVYDREFRIYEITSKKNKNNKYIVVGNDGKYDIERIDIDGEK